MTSMTDMKAQSSANAGLSWKRWPNTRFHVFMAKPNRAPTTQRRVAGGEDDLFVGAHAQNLMRKDQRPAAELLRSRRNAPFILGERLVWSTSTVVSPHCFEL